VHGLDEVRTALQRGLTTMRADREKLLKDLETKLEDLFRLRQEGVTTVKFAREQGYVDGFMRILIEQGIFTRKELLDLVVQQRVRSVRPVVAVAAAQVL
jgi:hypothetical protein